MTNIINKSNVKSVRWAFNFSAWHPTDYDMLKVSSGIQKEEKYRIGLLVFKRDAKASLAGRLLMRKYIVDSTGLEWKAINIVRDQNGKPSFTHGDFSLPFNVAHQGHYTVFAGEPNVNMVGVDVMKVEYHGRSKPVSKFFETMRRQFTEEEWRAIRSVHTESEQLARFYRFWCLKESYLKATGTGITVPLNDVSFKLNTLNLSKDEFVDDTELYLKGIKQPGWTFQEILLDDKHVAAVGLNVSRDTYLNWPEKVTKFQFVDYGELVKDCQPINHPDLAYCRQFFNKRESPHVSDDDDDDCDPW